MTAELTALMTELNRQRTSERLMWQDKVADLTAALDERNQLLQVVAMILDDVSVGRLDEDTMRLAADLLPRIAALGGRRA